MKSPDIFFKEFSSGNGMSVSACINKFMAEHPDVLSVEHMSYVSDRYACRALVCFRKKKKHGRRNTAKCDTI